VLLLVLTVAPCHAFLPPSPRAEPAVRPRWAVDVGSASDVDCASTTTAAPAASNGGGNNSNNNDNNNNNGKKEIVASARITLPFPAAVAFDAFADLPRQPSWSPWLREVRYLDDDSNDDGGAGSQTGIPFRQTRWTMGYRGFRFSWDAVSTRLERPAVIEWKSTSGLRNFGSVRFTEGGTATAAETEMVLSLTFVAPRVIAALFRRSSRIQELMETMLTGTLVGFRDVVLEEDVLPARRSTGAGASLPPP